MLRDAVHDLGDIERRRNITADFGERGCLARAALRLVEQPGILECHAHAVGQRLQQAHVRIAEGVLALRIDQREQSPRLIAGH